MKVCNELDPKTPELAVCSRAWCNAMSRLLRLRHVASKSLGLHILMFELSSKETKLFTHLFLPGDPRTITNFLRMVHKMEAPNQFLDN
jgi:hypothetical protein